jgi:hypothetical protein
VELAFAILSLARLCVGIPFRQHLSH